MISSKRDNHVILGVHITDRIKEAPEVQKSLTTYGGYIKTRLGLHEVEEPQGTNVGSKNGLLLLEMVGSQEKAEELAAKLNAIEGVEVKTMVFTHSA